jgi:hypothetical protein
MYRWTDNEWYPLNNTGVAASYIPHLVPLALKKRKKGDDGEDEGDGGSVETANQMNKYTAALEERDTNRALDALGYRPIPYPKETWSALTVASPFIPVAAGKLRHPIVGEPKQRWLYPRAAPHPVEDGYPHLNRLFSGLQFAPGGREAIMALLLGALHAESLNSPRPILFVDAWCRSRGKSRAGLAVATVLDGSPDCIVLGNGRINDRDLVTSFLYPGRRVVTTQNLDRVNNYSNPQLAALSTDGGLNDRAKFGRESTSFPHVLVVMNAVYGAASLSRDFVSRIWRAEILGRPADPNKEEPLKPDPVTYAVEYRDAILAEGLHALEHSTPYADTNTRFPVFEARGLAAWARVSGGDPRPAFLEMLEGRTSFLPHVVGSLWKAQPSAFDAPPDKAKESAGGRHNVPEGARALGFVFRGGCWNAV